MKPALHIVEPTLAGFTGHCHSLVRSLAAAAAHDCEVTIWAGRDAVAGTWDGAGRLQPHFHRRWRRLQCFLLYRRLLREPGRILVATAGSADLALAAWAAGRRAVAPGRMHFFVHWLGRKAGKAGLLSSIARRQPNFEILAPTAAVAGFFAACGFCTTQVPYPLDRDDDEPSPSGPSAPFRHLLVAGEARFDKGFGHIVELVHEMKRRGLCLPIVVQVSHDERDAPAPDIASAIERLRSAQYAGLSMLGETLGPQAYRNLFEGAVVVQPYRAADFSDRVSGVTLDALAAGCPAVVTAGTWMAGVVQRFDAGVATADLGAAGLLRAIESVVADHARYAANARTAACQLNAQHSARRLLDVVLRRPAPDAR